MMNRSENIRTQLLSVLEKEFPQIPMHGGTASITKINLKTKSASIVLSGECYECGLAPMTIKALKKRISAEVEEIDYVYVTIEDQTPDHI